MYEQYKLKNKVNVILVPQVDARSVITLVMYPVGSRYEAEKMSGVSHYVEHLMFKGTKKRKNTLILTREIDRLGAEYNAFTGKEYTGYYIKTGVDFTDVSMDILSDMVFNSTFDPKEMEREKTVIVEEIKMYNDNPLMNIDNIFEELMYKGCPLGMDIAGTEKHVLGYKVPDVLAYRDKYYQPSNITLVVAGAVNDQTKLHIENYFGKQKDSKRVSKSFKPGVFGSSSIKNRISVQKRKTDQAQMMLGWPGFSYTDIKENIFSSVMSTILGGSMSSRLFIQIRERRGLAYMVRSSAENFRDTGHFFVRVGLDAKNINKAIFVIQKECLKIAQKGVTKQELLDAKTHIRGSLTLSLENSSAQAHWYAGQSMFMNEISNPEDRLKMVEEVTNDDIKSIANKIFKMDKMRVAIIGDVDKDNVKF